MRVTVADGHERLVEELCALTDETIMTYVQWSPRPSLPPFSLALSVGLVSQSVPAQMWTRPVCRGIHVIQFLRTRSRVQQRWQVRRTRRHERALSRLGSGATGGGACVGSGMG